MKVKKVDELVTKLLSIRSHFRMDTNLDQSNQFLVSVVKFGQLT